ncbi:28 kDa heat- and acid-stable phosphoprotein-like isoform X2 [Acyrthosiphon pisum]|uniref:Casein kinase substrate phosphoprotein PP28 domain-containing protein n=1 Tax=Acyrthosiphon pisum TaxID=7029 RepID=A0A8R2A930_ACYPI|nr:28 kDa heat- and acid-stable phosphoprotein-like isoform X2 [Acyrthosiphon pisum]|eukprot:XP_003245387.1 PREDICTED: 28 kDa heat- and acid-stable phosphoprotein-like [Acyrthosiphon pisum]
MTREEGSNKEINDEFANTEELEKQRVRDEQGRITNIHKEADKQNPECKGNKSDSDEDISKTGNESNAGSDAEGVTHVIQMENSNRKKLKLLQRLSSLNAFFADTSEPVSLFKHEREQIEKDQQQQNYQNLHTQGDTEQAQSDLATNVADDNAIRTIEENEKSEEEMVMVKALPKLQNNSGK